MYKKFGLFFAFMIVAISSFSYVNGQMENDSTPIDHNPPKDLSDLLKNEDKSEFLTNRGSGDFQTIFFRKTIDPSNNILIKSGTSVKLTGSLDRVYSTILVEGKLKIIDTGDSSLRVQKIVVGPTGSLTIGTNENPIDEDKQVEIVFINSKDGEVGIFVFGKLLIHGKEVNPTFVGLESHAKKWEKRLDVNSELKNWERGDTVVITSPGIEKCNEIAKISKIVNQRITLMNSLNCSHRVISETQNPLVSHVALLSRNVIITSEDLVDRGSVNFFHGSTGYVKYANFDMLGPKEVLGRYPIHFHHLKDSSRGIEVIGNSITNSENRWITIHDSNGILVKNNVGYISQGHGFFLEAGTEFDNVFENNIGIITNKELILDSRSSVFWTMNPDNIYRNNVAVSAQYWGFFFEIPDEVVNLPNSDKQINLRSLPSLEFEDNTAYNNRHGGMKIIRYKVQEVESSFTEIRVSNFQALGSPDMADNHFGILISGYDVSISNSSILNHKIGIQIGGTNNKVLNTKIKMERTAIPDTDISGIIIAGSNHLIENSQIEGYVSRYNNDAYDISVYNNEKNKRLISAKIVNSSFLDPQPIHFGNPGNEKSFLEIYGYDAPQTKSKKLAQNFMLKQIGSDNIEERGEYNDLDFDAMIKMLPIQKTVNQPDKTNENDDRIKSILISSLKSKANAWAENQITDEKFLTEIEILFESRIIELDNLEQGSFQQHQFVMPSWVKNISKFWFDNSISEQEFINAIKYVLESSISKNPSYG